MNSFVLSQILVGIAICFDLLSFQLKKRTHIVLCLSVAGVFISTHFLLLEKWTAAILMMIAVIRYVTSFFSTSNKLMVLFVSVSFVSAAITFQGYLSVFSCLGSLFQTLGAFKSDDKKLRHFMIIGKLLWLFNNYLYD